MAICPHINLSKPAKFKREHRVYLALSTPKCTHSPENQHTGNNPEITGGINTVDLGLWHEIERPEISGKMSKGISIEELRTDLPPPAAEEMVGRGGQVRENQLIQGNQG
jgi:hypothetical protein